MSPTSFTQALARASMLATQALPETLHARIADAVVLVRDGHCFQADDGTWSVQSATDPAQTYTHVNGQCPCEDARYHQPERGLCKHRLAVSLSRKVQALMIVAQRDTAPASPVAQDDCEAVTVQVTPVTSPLYEAPASANCHITISGRQVQLTLRDRDEGRLLERLQAVLAQYPAPQPPSAPASSQGQGWCSQHGLQMKLNQKNGNQWFSHRLATGEYCKGK